MFTTPMVQHPIWSWAVAYSALIWGGGPGFTQVIPLEECRVSRIVGSTMLARVVRSIRFSAIRAVLLGASALSNYNGTAARSQSVA